ncbi:nucleotide exchange factor GrpE [Gulosibacter molinativorax]|uniref:Protein GrpE n=1 Tax=Gulosibacter molinativorax TaxID=256821 RepID=A0ABT7C7V6_9MICO|nr:nucleotide exchange factor GrpE [Gulosibacter molinativorax]MDJ1370741.1 nucleotide exchange factor GrpE [Gulosibacter molinativorax]QUY63232.1 Protein GrpE [Gulosibacter molinativorax]
MTQQNPNEHEEPIIRDKRRIDPETGKVREPNPDAQSNDVEDAVADAIDAETERETISEEELQSLLTDAMSASTASDLPEDAPASAVEETEDARLAREHLDDLRRVQAEYTNFRRRTEREKEELASVATANVVTQLLPVLDDLGRAEAAGDLPEGSALQVIAAKLHATIERLGVEPYGEKGEAFDPNIHEAIAQLPNPEVTEHTIADVVERGYRIGEREIRPAKVAVFVPAE